MKENLIEEIKELIKIKAEDVVTINPNYLEYFEEEELIEIRNQLIGKKQDIKNITASYLDEIYEKTKKDEI